MLIDITETLSAVGPAQMNRNREKRQSSKESRLIKVLGAKGSLLRRHMNF